MQPSEVETLFRSMRDIVTKYPNGMREVRGGILGTAFFPGGRGLFVREIDDAPPWPAGNIMVVGNDWGPSSNIGRSCMTNYDLPRGVVFVHCSKENSRGAS